MSTAGDTAGRRTGTAPDRGVAYFEQRPVKHEAGVTAAPGHAACRSAGIEVRRAQSSTADCGTSTSATLAGHWSA